MRGERASSKNILKFAKFATPIFLFLSLHGAVGPASASPESSNQTGDTKALCDPGLYAVNVNGSRARTGPGTEYSVNSYLQYGQLVDVDGPATANYPITSNGTTSDKWCHTTDNNYVFSGLVSPVSQDQSQQQNTTAETVSYQTSGLNLDNCTDLRNIGTLPEGRPVYTLRGNASSLTGNQIMGVLGYMSTHVPHTLWAGSDWYSKPIVIEVSDSTDVISTQGYMGMTTPADENQCSFQASNQLQNNTVAYVYASSRWGQEVSEVILIHQLSVTYGANDLWNGQKDDTGYWGRADYFVQGNIANSGVAGRAVSRTCDLQDQDCMAIEDTLSNP